MTRKKIIYSLRKKMRDNISVLIIADARSNCGACLRVDHNE